MRTTISLDDRLAARVRRAAADRGVSVSAFIARTLNDALTRSEAAAPKPFQLIVVGGGGLRAGIDLDRPRALDVDDDEQRFGRRGRRRDPVPEERVQPDYGYVYEDDD